MKRCVNQAVSMCVQEPARTVVVKPVWKYAEVHATQPVKVAVRPHANLVAREIAPLTAVGLVREPVWVCAMSDAQDVPMSQNS